LGGSDGVMEKENINNNIEEDLNRRNRNWQEIEDYINNTDIRILALEQQLNDYIEDTDAKILSLEQRIEELETE
jgi:superfamily I DNA and/or RNA helicase